MGSSLYINVYYVLAELIANVYDADAKNVYIIEKDNKIIVEDDGNGMSYKKGISINICKLTDYQSCPMRKLCPR